MLPLRDVVASMGQRFLTEGIVELDAAADSAIIQCKKVWHKSDMEKGLSPTSGIDVDARWGFSKAKGWVFGYKLHMSCSTGKLEAP